MSDIEKKLTDAITKGVRRTPGFSHSAPGALAAPIESVPSPQEAEASLSEVMVDLRASKSQIGHVLKTRNVGLETLSHYLKNHPLIADYIRDEEGRLDERLLATQLGTSLSLPSGHAADLAKHMVAKEGFPHSQTMLEFELQTNPASKAASLAEMASIQHGEHIPLHQLAMERMQQQARSEQAPWMQPGAVETGEFAAPVQKAAKKTTTHHITVGAYNETHVSAAGPAPHVEHDVLWSGLSNVEQKLMAAPMPPNSTLAPGPATTTAVTELPADARAAMGKLRPAVNGDFPTIILSPSQARVELPIGEPVISAQPTQQSADAFVHIERATAAGTAGIAEDIEAIKARDMAKLKLPESDGKRLINGALRLAKGTGNVAWGIVSFPYRVLMESRAERKEIDAKGNTSFLESRPLSPLEDSRPAHSDISNSELEKMGIGPMPASPEEAAKTQAEFAEEVKAAAVTRAANERAQQRQLIASMGGEPAPRKPLLTRVLDGVKQIGAKRELPETSFLESATLSPSEWGKLSTQTFVSSTTEASRTYRLKRTIQLGWNKMLDGAIKLIPGEPLPSTIPADVKRRFTPSELSSLDIDVTHDASGQKHLDFGFEHASRGYVIPADMPEPQVAVSHDQIPLALEGAESKVVTPLEHTTIGKTNAMKAADEAAANAEQALRGRFMAQGQGLSSRVKGMLGTMSHRLREWAGLEVEKSPEFKHPLSDVKGPAPKSTVLPSPEENAEHLQKFRERAAAAEAQRLANEGAANTQGTTGATSAASHEAAPKPATAPYLPSKRLEDHKRDQEAKRAAKGGVRVAPPPGESVLTKHRRNGHGNRTPSILTPIDHGMTSAMAASTAPVIDPKNPYGMNFQHTWETPLDAVRSATPAHADVHDASLPNTQLEHMTPGTPSSAPTYANGTYQSAPLPPTATEVEVAARMQAGVDLANGKVDLLVEAPAIKDWAKNPALHSQETQGLVNAFGVPTSTKQVSAVETTPMVEAAAPAPSLKLLPVDHVPAAHHVLPSAAVGEPGFTTERAAVDTMLDANSQRLKPATDILAHEVEPILPFNDSAAPRQWPQEPTTLSPAPKPTSYAVPAQDLLAPAEVPIPVAPVAPVAPQVAERVMGADGQIHLDLGAEHAPRGHVISEAPHAADTVSHAGQQELNWYAEAPRMEDAAPMTAAAEKHAPTAATNADEALAAAQDANQYHNAPKASAADAANAGKFEEAAAEETKGWMKRLSERATKTVKARPTAFAIGATVLVGGAVLASKMHDKEQQPATTER